LNATGLRLSSKRLAAVFKDTRVLARHKKILPFSTFSAEDASGPPSFALDLSSFLFARDLRTE